MPNQVSYNAGATTNMAGSQANYAFTSSFAPVGSKRSDLIVDIDENGEELSVGQCASVSLFMAQVLSGGPAGATVTFYADNAYKQVIANKVLPGMLGCLLFAPLGGIYAKANRPPTKEGEKKDEESAPPPPPPTVVQVRVIAVEL